MGLADIAFLVWDEYMRFNPEAPKWAARDRFVLSCGHASMLQEAHASVTAIPWESLPSHLQAGGVSLQQALESHNRGRNRLAEGALTTGLTGLLAQPEFSRPLSLRPLLELVEQCPHELLTPRDAQAFGGVWIGGEHPNPALDGCAVVQARYHSRSGAEGQVALVGPMRMAYANACAAVQSVAASLSRLLG